MSANGTGRLADLANEINATLKREDKLRLVAAALLAEAYKLITAEKLDWEKWCAANIQRSPRDIRRLLAIHSASKPEEALRQEQAKAREGMRKGAAKLSPGRNRRRPTLDLLKDRIRRLPYGDSILLHGWHSELLKTQTKAKEAA